MSAIRCPNCRELNTKLVDAIRERKKGYCRRYKCLSCNYRFTTLEEWCPEPKFGESGKYRNSRNTVKLDTVNSEYSRRKENG